MLKTKKKRLKKAAPKSNKVSPEWSSPYTQQGDCLIKKVGAEFKDVFETSFDEIPSDAKPVKSRVLLKGLNNSHAIVKGECDIFEKDGRIFLVPKTDCILDHVTDMRTLRHAEHRAQVIPPREKGYFVDAVNEFDHGKEEQRKVID